MTHVFQLVAKGRLSCFEGVHEVRSWTVFPTEEAASERLDKFRKMVTEPGIFALSDDEGLTVKVVALELVITTLDKFARTYADSIVVPGAPSSL
mgnify:CR=1 FL=1